ncbi:hypothetical protein AVXHC21_28140 [Acidovorax sacchari]
MQAGITEAKPAGLSQLYYRYDDQGNVTAMTDALGRSIAMQYDAHGNQTLKVDPLGNTVVRTYDDRNQLLTETLRAGDGNNNTATTPVFGGSTSPGTPPDSTTRYIYSAQERGQLRFVVSAEGRVTEYRYNSLGQRETTLAYAAAAYDLASLGSTSVPTEAQMAFWAAGQDLRGGQRTDLHYDFRGQLAQSIAYGTLDASGAGSDPAVTQYVYSQAGELLKTVQPRTDSITQYVYDGLGRVIVASAPSSDGTSANTTITSYGDTTTTVTLANGLSTVSNYDAAGRLTSVLQSSAGTTLGITRYAYDTAGRLVMTQDATGVRQWVVYDAAGRKVADVDGTGAAREYRYNANDQLTQTIEYATRLAGLPEAPKLEAIRALASAGDRSSWRLYDSAQRLAWQVDAGGAVTQTEYDAASRVVAVTRLATPIDTAMLGDGSAFLVGGAGLVRMDSAGLAATAIAMRTSAASVPAGSALTLEAAVSGSQPAGTVTFYSGNTVLGTAQISNGIARLTLGTLATGTYAFTARYEGDATHAAATSAAASATVLQAARVTLDPLPATLAAGRASVLKATITGTSPGGTVTFFDGATVIGSAVVQTAGGISNATLAWSTQDLGNHAISAVYSGDAANAQAVTASSATVKVGRGSEIALDSSATPSTAGTPLAVRARVSVPGGQAQPTGSVAFYRGSELLGTATLDGQGLAVLNTSALPVGLHAITAVYQGDDSVAGSSSATFAQTVLPPAATTAVLATSHVQVATGGGLTLTARIAAVADPAAAPGGTVTFFDGDTRLGSVALANGQASFSVTGVGAGSHGYRAVYSGDTADAGSTSATASVMAVANGPDIATPGGGARTLALSASASNVAKGGVVTLTATVAGDRPTGSVVFVSGGKILGSASLADGKAVLSFTPLEAGLLDVQALYSGDAANPAVASAQPVRLTVAPTAPGMALSLSSTQAVRGAAVVLTATLSGSDGTMPPTGSVTFYANGLALGTAMLSQGQASLGVSTLDVGANAITVQYAGDARNAAATSAAQSLRIVPAPATVALGVSAVQAVAGAALTFTATVAPAAGGAAPSGRVDFFNGTSFLGSAVLANGVAALTTSALRNAGAANITAVYTGDVVGAVSPSLAVSISSGVDISVSSPRIVSGNPVVLSANVGSGTGQVSFFDGSVYLGSANVSDGVARLTTKALTQAGSHAITAVFAGDANRAGAASAAVAIQVADAVELAVSGSSVVAGTPLVLTASVNSATSALVNGVAVPAGAIANGVTLIDGTVTKTSGTADWESSIRSTVGVSGGASVSFRAGQTNKAIMVGLNTDPGTNDNYLTIDWAIYVTYDGAMYAYQNGTSVASLGTYTTGDVLSVEYANGVVSYRKNGAVLRQESANITQPLYLDSSFYGTGGSIAGLKFRNGSGQEVPLNAAAAPTGTVTFFNGRQVLGTASVVNGVARLTTGALAAGTAQVTAVYSGDANNAAASSAANAVAVNDAVGVSASATTIAAGNAVRLTARMNAQPSVVTSGVSFESGAIRKTGTASQWDASVRSTVGYAGGASVRFTVAGQSDQNYVIGLNTDPASDNGVASLDWAIHVSGETVELYHDGILVANVGTVVAGDVLALGYDNGVLSFSKNGVVFRRDVVQISQPLYLDSSFYTPGSSVSGLEFRDATGTAVALSAKPAATGRVTFHSGGTVLGTATLVDGVASLTTQGLTAAGVASITAMYESDTDGTKAQSQPLAIVVSGGDSQSATAANAPVLSVSSPKIVSGNPVLLSANVGSGTGSVNFFDGSVYLGSASAVNGVASLTTKALTRAGSHSITAVYAGDANRAGAASAALAIQVADAVELAVSGNSVAAGTPLALTASVNSATSALVNGVVVPAGAIVNGVAIIDGTVTKTSSTADWESSIRSTVGVSGGASVSFSAGQTNKAIMVGLSTAPGTNSHYLSIDWAIYITYDGAMHAYHNGDYVASLGTYTTGDVLSVEYANGTVSYRKNGAVLRQESANITQPLYLDTSFYGTGGAIAGLKFRNATGQEVPLNAAAAPTGTVTFFNGRQVLGTASVVNGVARLTTGALAAGTAQITAVYSGDAGNAAATSAATVMAVTDSIGLSASSTSVTAGDAVTLAARMNQRPSAMASGVSFESGAVSKTGTASQWDASVRSTVGYAGGASVRFTVSGQPDQRYMVGLNTDPATDNDASSIDWAIHVTGSTVELYHDGSRVATLGSIVAGDVLALGYENGVLSYSKNGVVWRRDAVQISQPLYLDSSFYAPGSSVSGLEFRDAAGTLVALSAKPVATGRVTFHSGGAVLGTATLVDGVASLTTQGLTAAGVANVTATYEGDAYNAAGFSSVLVLAVKSAQDSRPSTTTSLITSTAATTRGQEVALTATVSGNASGFVTFFNGDQALGVAALANGVAVWKSRDLPVGAYAWRAVYTGDAQSAPSNSSAVGGSIVAMGAGVSLAATVTGRSGSEATVTLAARVAGLRPGGTVTFYNNDAPIGGGTATVVDGVATLSVTLPSGSTRITARYSGDASNGAATSDALALGLRSASTVTVTAPSPVNASYGSPVTLSATAPYSNSSSGTVTFYAGELLVGVAAVQANGVATLVSSAIPVGSRTITAAYSGNTEREPASQSASAPLTITGMATQTVLTTSRSTLAAGTPLVLDATITSGGRTAGIAGTVRFYAGSTFVGTAQATDGVARITLADVSSGALTAVYDGFQGFSGSTSQAATSFVLAAATTIALSSSAASVGADASVTLSARIDGRQPGGTVIFLRGDTVLGTAQVVDGVARLVVGGLPPGTHELRARYEGDARNAASASAALAQAVTPAGTVVLGLASDATLAQGQDISITVGGGAGGSVTLVDGHTVVATARVVNGVAILSTRGLAAGGHTLTAHYAADSGFASAQIGFALTLTPSQGSTTVALSATSTRTPQGLGALLSAQVSGDQPGGRVAFYNGDQLLGTVDLAYGLAVLEVGNPPSVLDRFRAVYLGDGAHAGSTSATLGGQAISGETVSPLVRSTQDRTASQIHGRDGLLLGTVDGEGYLTEYRYDAAGRVIGSVRYAQPVAGGAAAGLAAARAGSLSGLRPAASVGDAHTAYFYDAQGRRVGELDAEGYLTQSSYDANGNLATVRRYATAVGATTAAQVTAATRLESLLPGISAQDQVSTRTYDALNRVVLSVNAEGTATSYRYDAMGRLVETVQAAGTPQARTTGMRYDAQGRLVGELSAQGAAQLASARAAGQGDAQLEAIWQQYGLSHTYDAAGRRTSTTDQNGLKTQFFYDAASRLTHTVNAQGEVTETRYDAFGQVQASIRHANRLDLFALANASGTPGGVTNAGVLAALDQARNDTADRTTGYRYNATGTLAQVSDALGFARNYVYNTFGEEVRRTGGGQTVATTYDRRGLAVQTVQDPDGLKAATSVTYDAFGRVTASTDAMGATRTQAYDRLGRTIVLTDAMGRRSTSSYDAFGRTVTQTDALGHTTTYAYNPDELSLTVITPEGVRVTTVHDRLGQTVSVTDGSGATTRYEYDADGHQTAVQTPLARTTGLYDVAGRLIQATDANGVMTSLAYDAAGRVLTRIVDPLGLNLVTRYTYDALGNQLSVTDAQGVVTQFGYDAKGQLIRQAVDPTGLNLVTTFAYDSAGRQVSVTDPNGTVTRYEYDTLGRRVLEVVDPSTATHAGLNLARRYTYDALGHVTSATDAQGHTTRYAYDAEGRQRFVLDAAGNLAETSYDAAGRVVRQTRYAAVVPAPDGLPSNATEAQLNGLKRPNAAQDQTEHRIYDADNRVTATVNGAGDVVRFAYDGAGRVIQRTAYARRLDMASWAVGTDPQPGTDAANSPDLVTRTVYDAAGRVRYSIDGTGAVVSQRYDGNGNVTQRIRYAKRLDLASQPLSAHPSESEMELRLVYIFDAQRDEHTRMRYDAAGRLTLSADGAGGVSQYLYDKAGHLLQSTRYATPTGGFAWRDEGTTGFVGTQPAAGQHAISAFGADGQPAEILGYVDDTQAAGNAALYLARNTDGSYFYTTDTKNLELVRTIAGWSVEGVVGYIRTAPTQGTTALYRLNLQGHNTNRYTTSRAEVDGTLIPVPQASNSDAFVRKVYDKAGRLTKEVDASGAVSTYDYDAAGRLVRETRLAVPATTYRNAQAGAMLLAEPTPVASSGDRTTRHFLDRAGRETLTIDAEGGATERFYDGTGQLLRVRQVATQLTDTQIAQLESLRAQTGELSRSAINQQMPGSANDRNTRNYYDAAGRLAFTRDALGHLQGYTYDGVGRTTSRTLYMREQSPDYWVEEGITGFTRTGGGDGLKPLYRLGGPDGVNDHLYTTSDDERAQLIASGWKDQGNVGYVGSQPASGTAPLYRLRPPGSSSTNHYYTASEEQRAFAKNQFGWVDEGIIGYIDIAPSSGNTALYQLNVDGTGRHFHSLSRSEVDYALMPNPGFTQGLDHRESMAYDAAGNLTGSTDADNKTETTAYDGAGRKTSFTNKAQSTWTYAYNAAGQLVQETSPQVMLSDGQNATLASVVTRMEYDALGHLTARTEAAGRNEQRTTRYEYDALGRQVKTLFPPVSVYQDEGANLLANGRSGAGTRTEQTVETSSETRYDTLGRAVAGRAAGSSAWSYKAYDRAGQVAWDVDALGYVTGYTRNAFGEAERLVRYAQNITTRTDGVLMREDEVRGAITARAGSTDRDILTGYDRLGRVKEVQEPYVFFVDSATGEQGGGRKTTRNSYDALGNLTSVATNVGASQWATTHYGYDVLGRRTSTIDALGYLTTDRYDTAGNVVRHAEYYKQGVAIGTDTDPAAGDRVIDTDYDVLGRKMVETRRGVGYARVNAGAADIGGVLTDARDDLVTLYAYDALGNLLRTTDALGATTYQFYDVLGRVRAIVTPAVNIGVAANQQGAAPVSPLTEFRRDAHGNAVSTVQYAGGATVSGDGRSYTANAAPGSLADRTSYTRFDAQGHTLETIDAAGKSHYYAYDAQGRLAKEWQNVSYVDDAGAKQVHSLWRAYRYDALGRQTHTYTPLQDSPDPASLRLGDTELQYNGFGEVTRKIVRQLSKPLEPGEKADDTLGMMAPDGTRMEGDEVYDYDNAGRVWRSNAGDGVMKIWAYDLQGRQTVQLVGAGRFKLDSYDNTQQALGVQQTLVVKAGETGEFRRTDMQYDLLGRLVKTLAPERASEKAMGITTRQNLVYGVITGTEVRTTYNNSQDIQVTENFGQNQVDLVWNSLQDLGSGDVRVTLNYMNTSNEAASRSIVVGAEESVNGYSFKWKSASQSTSVGIQSIQNIKVEKLDIFGNWTTIYDADTRESKPGPIAWTEQPSPGLIWNEPGAGRKPIYRYYNRYTQTHFFSTDTADRQKWLGQGSGWLDEGIAGYVAEQPAAGLTALYRLVKKNSNVSVYTTDVNQFNNLRASDWEDRGIDGYVGVAGSAAAPAGMTKLYALQHHISDNGDTEWKDGLYTTSLSDRRALLQGLSSGSKGSIGRVVTLYGAMAAQTIEVSLPQNLVTRLRMEVRSASGGEWRAVRLTNAQHTFGSAHRIELNKLVWDDSGQAVTVGGYEYRMSNVQDTDVREVGTGTFSLYGNGVTDTISFPPVQDLGVIRAAIDSRAQQVMRWQQAAPDQNVTFKWKPKDSADWEGSRSVGRGVFTQGDGRTTGFGAGYQGVALDMSGGIYQYEVVVSDASGATVRRSEGVMTVPGVSLIDTTPPILQKSNNVENLGILGYVWTDPGTNGTRKPLHRYYFTYENNDHHITTADDDVIQQMNDLVARGDMKYEGVLGYVDVLPSRRTSQALYQYKYGNTNVYRLASDPRAVNDGNFIVLNDKSPVDFQPGRWYQNGYQRDGYILTAPEEGTKPLYAVYDGNSFGNQGLGDYLTTTSEKEVTGVGMMNTDPPGRDGTAAKAKLTLSAGLAVIDGITHPVLQWNLPEMGGRAVVTTSPSIPGEPTPPRLFWQGDGRSQFVGSAAQQGFVLDGLTPGATYQVKIVIEHAATMFSGPYIEQANVTIVVPAGGVNGPVVLQNTTPVYAPQFRAQNSGQNNLTNRPATIRGYDRWNNVTTIDETQGLGVGTLVRTATMRYDANNQVIEQSRLHEDVNFAQSWATTKVYYDAMGRQVGVRDALGNLNAQVRDLAGNVVQERHADGGRMDYTYNAFGDKASSAETMSAGRIVKTKYTYDQMSRLTQTSLDKAISRYWVDGNMNGAVAGNLYSADDDKGNGVVSGNDSGVKSAKMTVLETVEYDEAGRKVRVTNGNDESTRYRYDRMGNVVLSGQETIRGAGGATAPLAYTMRYRYDAQGRKVGQTDAMGMTQAWNYDIFGHLIGRTDAQSGGGAPVDFNYTYNLAGQLVHEDNTRVEPGVGGAAATSKKKNIDYRYDGAGQLIEIRDNYLGQTTRYEYDLAGNRVAEKMSQKTLLTSGLLDDVVYQDNHLVYDAQHRLRAVFDGRSDVRITYDLGGNRQKVTTHVINTIRTTTDQGGLQERQVVHTDTTDFLYDGMNRQIWSRQTSSVTGAIETHRYSYDLAGNRIMDQTYSGPPIPKTDNNPGSPDGKLKKTYTYTYDDLHRIDYYRGDGASDQMDRILYDGAGRQVVARTLIGEDGGSYEYRYNQYDATGKLQDVHTVVRSSKTGDNQEVSQRSDVAYHDAGGVTGLGYDAAGNLKGVRQDGDGGATTTTYQYTYLNGSWQQSAAVTNRGSTQVATVTQRDANGFVVGIRQPKAEAQGGTDWIMAELNRPKLNDVRYDRTFVNDANGTAVFVSQGGYNDIGEVKSSIANPASGYQGGVTGSALTPGHVQRQLVANGEVLARYGDAPTQEENTPQTNNPAYVDTADFRLQAAQIRPRHKSLDPVAYTVVGGETLKDIARNVLGDASLWWRIADANSLAVSGDGVLTAGQTLTVPKLALNANSVETFQPYDPSQAMGSMDPVLPVPANGGGCGGIGAIIMIVIAVVVTIYTAGALAAAGSLGSNALGAATLAGTTTGGGFAATMAAGASVLGGGAGIGAGIAAGVAGGAMGSIVSQAVGNAIGAQDGFSWKGVALSALSGGVSGGLAGTSLLGGTTLGVTVARAAASSVLAQGIGVATGLQSSFSWKSVAASAAGAGVGWGMNNAFGLTDANGVRIDQSFGLESIGKATLSGVAAGLTTAVARGGRISVQQIATDAFGNALGHSLADVMSKPGTQPDELQGIGPWSERDYVNGSDLESDNAYYSRQKEHILARGGSSISDSVTPAEMMAYRMQQAGYGDDWSLEEVSLKLNSKAGLSGSGLKVGTNPFSYKSNSDYSVNADYSLEISKLRLSSQMGLGVSPELGFTQIWEYSSNYVGGAVKGFVGFFAETLPNIPKYLYGLTTRPLEALESAAYGMQNSVRQMFVNSRRGEFATAGAMEGGFLGEQVAGAALGWGVGIGAKGVGAGMRYTVNALPDSAFNGLIQASNFIDRATYLINPFNYNYAGVAGTLGSGLVPTGLKMSGIVEVRVPFWATAAQKADYNLYTQVANEALNAGYLSPTGRVSTNGALRMEANRAIAAERALAEQQGRPYQGVVGHGPDTTWTGKPGAYRWIDQDWRVNSSLGGQAGRYPIGFKPSGFVLKGM